MAYSKTTWTELTTRTLARLNNLETQYDEAITDAIALRSDNTEELRVQVAAAPPAGAQTGQLYFNSVSERFYVYDGTNWVWLAVANDPLGSDPAALPGVDFFNGNERVGMVVYKTPGTYTLPVLKADTAMEILVVAGGGGGGRRGSVAQPAGGGGAGGMLYDAVRSVAAGNYTVTVGAGGTGSDDYDVRGGAGGNSVFDVLTAVGGGGGGSLTTEVDGGNGGSGGGGRRTSSAEGAGGTGTAGQGNDGGAASIATNESGGGGGAGAVGTARNGGAGSVRFGYTYATGGAGALLDSALGTGATTVTNNSGNGGTVSLIHATAADRNGKDGSSGIVIVRWGGYANNYDPDTDTVT